MLKKIDKKYLILGGLIIGVFVLILVIILVISLFKGEKGNYNDIETRMRQSAIEYYEKHEDELPKNDGSTVSISIEKLVSSGNLSSLDNSLEEGVSCKGEVSVTNNNEHYVYLPNLDCGEAYKTEKLADKIVETDVINEVGEGLYEDGEDYVYRGENVNNYLSFADKLWRIIRITEDGTIRIIAVDRLEQISWDDRYNVDKEYNSGINNYSLSRIKDRLKEIYEDDEIFTDEQRTVITTQDLCVAHRSEDSSVNDGSIECGNIFEGQQLGLLQLNEYIIPSLDDNCSKPSDRSCTNYNYLAEFERAFWTITGDSDTTHLVYAIDGYATLKTASNTSGINLVINLTKNLLYSSGIGTMEDPYTFVQYKN